MPIYEFECSGCRKKIELVLPIKDRNSLQTCPECCGIMNRLVELPQPPIVPITGRNQVLGNLNAKDDGLGNKPHIKNAMAKGLDPPKEVVGRGFG